MYGQTSVGVEPVSPRTLSPVLSKRFHLPPLYVLPNCLGFAHTRAKLPPNDGAPPKRPAPRGAAGVYDRCRKTSKTFGQYFRYKRQCEADFVFLSKNVDQTLLTAVRVSFRVSVILCGRINRFYVKNGDFCQKRELSQTCGKAIIESSGVSEKAAKGGQISSGHEKHHKTFRSLPVFGTEHSVTLPF